MPLLLAALRAGRDGLPGHEALGAVWRQLVEPALYRLRNESGGRGGLAKVLRSKKNVTGASDTGPSGGQLRGPSLLPDFLAENPADLIEGRWSEGGPDPHDVGDASSPSSTAKASSKAAAARPASPFGGGLASRDPVEERLLRCVRLNDVSGATALLRR